MSDSRVPASGSALVHRALDATRFNAIINHPKVRPWVANDEDGVIDLANIVANERNVLLMGEHGGVLFLWLQPGVYEAHTAVLPEGRGSWMRAMSEAVASYMFTATDAYEVLTRVPGGHVAARAAADAQGFRYQFTRDPGCRFRNRVVPMRVYSIWLQDWILGAPGLIERGRWVHERMHAEAHRLGVTETPHENDDNQNRIIGAVYEMVRNGNCDRAVWVYNRWAGVCRHPLVQLVSREPPTIRFDIGLMRLLPDGDIEVVREP